MTTATQPNPREGVLILDQLDMLVTNEPIAELDAALATVTTHLHLARERGDSRTVERLVQWIDHRLDQRNGFSP